MIDDEIDYCRIMQSYFTRKNYAVSVAYTLEDGLALLNSESPDILFLDNNLPDGKGWSHVENIVEKNPHLRVYLVSAYDQEQNFSNFFNRMPQNKIFRERKRRPEPLEQLDSTLTGEDTRDVNEILDDDPMEQDIMGSFSPPSEISQNSQDHFTTDDNNSTIDVPSENGETLVKKITITFDMATCGKL